MADIMAPFLAQIEPGTTTDKRAHRELSAVGAIEEEAAFVGRPGWQILRNLSALAVVSPPALGVELGTIPPIRDPGNGAVSNDTLRIIVKLIVAAEPDTANLKRDLLASMDLPDDKTGEC